MAIVIIVAGGSGRRMMLKENKIFLALAGNALIQHCVSAAVKAKTCRQICLVAKKQEWAAVKKAIGKHKKMIIFAKGGPERMDSVMNGLAAIRGAVPDEIIVVHNAANPWISSEEIDAIVEQARTHGAAMAGFPVVDTLKRVDKNGMVSDTIDRSLLWHAQTPQAARYSLLQKGYALAKKKNIIATDEGVALSLVGQKIKIVPTSRRNVKITFPSDLALLEDYSQAQIGFGKDTHLFVKGKQLVLGGLQLQHSAGMKGNSDGDVVLHALCTALAQGWGGYSLGHYTDSWCKKEGITSSKEYVKRFMGMLSQKKLRVRQLGVMIETNKIKIDPLIDSMKSEIGKLVKIPSGKIGISATSGEGLAKGITAYCIAVVESWKQ